MMTISRRVFTPTAAFLATAALAQAHPGHDGHDLTWDFGHLAAYPGATIFCAGVLGLVGWVVWKLVGGTAEAPKRIPIRIDDSRRRR